MIIKSSFSDVYDFIMQQYEMQPVQKQDYKEIVYNRELGISQFNLTSVIESQSFIQLLNLVNSHSSTRDWKDTITTKEIKTKLNLNQFNQLNKWSLGHHPIFIKKNSLLIIGLDIYIVKQFICKLPKDQISFIYNQYINDLQENDLLVTEIEHYGNILDLKINIPNHFLHKPIVLITEYYEKNKKDYMEIHNFSLSNWNMDIRHNLCISIPTTIKGVFNNNHFVEQVLNLPHVYNSIESRLAYEKELINPMIEISNDNKIKKSGFSLNSFKKKSMKS